MADLKPIGRILGVIGGLLMIIIAIVFVVNNVVEEILDLSTLGLNIAGQMNLEEDIGWVVSAAVMAVCGIIAVFGYQKLASRDKGDLLLWGIIYIVVGIVGLGLGGFLVLVGGIILVIDYFI